MIPLKLVNLTFWLRAMAWSLGRSWSVLTFILVMLCSVRVV